MRRCRSVGAVAASRPAACAFWGCQRAEYQRRGTLACPHPTTQKSVLNLSPSDERGESSGGGTHFAPASAQEPVAEASLYTSEYIAPNEINELLQFCEEQPYIYYTYGLPDGKRVQLKRAPKMEYYLQHQGGKRPVYRWGQVEDFWQAGYEMPPTLRSLAERIYQDTGEQVNHAIIIAYFHGVQHHAPPHKDKAHGVSVMPGVPTDMARDASFHVISLGATREFTIQMSRDVSPAPATVVWRRALASGSMLRVSARDNREYYHAVPKQPGTVGTRYSIIFRTIGTMISVDAVQAKRVNAYNLAPNPQTRKVSSSLAGLVRVERE
jgi:hypothetical protein